MLSEMAKPHLESYRTYNSTWISIRFPKVKATVTNHKQCITKLLPMLHACVTDFENV